MAMDLEKMLKMSASELSTWLETKAVQLMYCDIFEGKLIIHDVVYNIYGLSVRQL